MWACCSDREYNYPFSIRETRHAHLFIVSSDWPEWLSTRCRFTGKRSLPVEMRPPEKAVKCPGCGSTKVVRRGTLQRLVHAPPMGTYKKKFSSKCPVSNAVCVSGSEQSSYLTLCRGKITQKVSLVWWLICER